MAGAVFVFSRRVATHGDWFFTLSVVSGRLLVVGKYLTEREVMKYVIRRAVLGAVATPIVAFAWVLFIAVLIGLGAEPTATANQVWNDGLWLGAIVAVLFTFGPLFTREK